MDTQLKGVDFVTNRLRLTPTWRNISEQNIVSSKSTGKWEKSHQSKLLKRFADCYKCGKKRYNSHQCEESFNTVSLKMLLLVTSVEEQTHNSHQTEKTHSIKL